MARAVPFALLTVVLLATGCTTPQVPYRYTGLTPASRPIAWDGRTAKAGTLRFDGTLNHESVLQNPAPQLHDTALFVPEWTAEGSAVIAVADELEMGLRASYASYDWGSASAVGTMPLPSRPSTWGIGPELRMAFPLDDKKRFALGIAANLTRYEVPYAEWSLTGPSSPNGNFQTCTPSPTCAASGGAYYTLHDERSESHLTYSLGIYPSFALGEAEEYGHLFALLAATNGFGNDGFTNTPTNGSTIRVTGPLWIVGGGYGMSIDWFRASAMLFSPLTDHDSPVNYGLGFQLSLGVSTELWAKAEPRPRRENRVN